MGDVLHALLHSIRNHIFLKKRLKKQKWGRMVRLEWLQGVYIPPHVNSIVTTCANHRANIEMYTMPHIEEQDM